MPQSTVLSARAETRVQIIAPDTHRVEQVQNSNKRMRLLHLSNLLSQELEVERIVRFFIAEIRTDFALRGYHYTSPDLHFDVSQGPREGACASYRLQVETHHLGEISIYSENRFSRYQLSDLEDRLCTVIYPLKNALLYQCALESAHQDPLTGLSNRRAMEKRLPREIELARRYSQPMAILMMDLDGFKQINDQDGHDAGDQVLCEVAQILQASVRSTDLLYRYGGDEFFGVLVQTNLPGAIEVSERIRQNIGAYAGQKTLGVPQISIGAILAQPKDDFSSVFKRADQALYTAKKRGKNCIATL